MSTIYEVLRRPIFTEKSNYLNSQLHQYVFEVADYATKAMVKEAIETLFEVKVLRVNIVNAAPKRTRRARSRRVLIRKPGYKKAIISLAPDDTIDIFEGVK